MGNYNIYKKYNKTKNRYRHKLNKIIRRNTKKMIPVLKKQIDKLSLISLTINVKGLKESIYSLNNSKFLIGVTMLLLNVGSRYVELGFSKHKSRRFAMV